MSRSSLICMQRERSWVCSSVTMAMRERGRSGATHRRFKVSEWLPLWLRQPRLFRKCGFRGGLGSRQYSNALLTESLLEYWRVANGRREQGEHSRRPTDSLCRAAKAESTSQGGHPDLARSCVTRDTAQLATTSYCMSSAALLARCPSSPSPLT